MKQLFSMVLAGIIGGLITFGGLQLLPDSNPVVSKTDAAIVRQINQPAAARGGGVPLDFTLAAELTMPAVVHISAEASPKPSSGNNNRRNRSPLDFFFDDNLFGNGQPQAGTGSGVIYSADGYIITNNHVVEFADKVEVTLFDNRKFSAKVVGTDPKTDLAVLKIEATSLPTLQTANSDQAKVGEWVLAVGNPFDLTSTVTAGIISAKGRSLRLLPGQDAIEAFIQTDAAVNPGNSGGALVDADGHLLGINTAIASQTGAFQGYSFAIPVNLVTRIVDDIINFGSYQRAFLGVNIYKLDSRAVEELNANINQGVVISELVDGGSAQYAGLQPQDIIVKVGDRDIRDVPELTEVVGRAKVGDTLNVVVNRKGKTEEIPVKMRPQKN